MKGFKIRLSRTFLVIIGGVTILGGGSGAAAVYIGADKLLGPSYVDINGLTCTTVETIRIKKADRYWIRKYVTTSEPGDGVARLKTALRVARKVQQTEQPDLVQVTVLDQSGPTERARMRGRMIGAQVVYMPDVAKAPEGVHVAPITAYYVDGAADQTGEFWGLRINLPQEDAEHLSAALTDDADCVDPLVEGAEGHGASGHGAADGHGAIEGHGKASGHGGTADHGGGHDGDHGAEPAAEGHAAPTDPHGEPAPAGEHEVGETPGLLASLMGMVGLGSAEPAEAVDGAASAPGHEPPGDDHLEPAQGAEAEHHEEPAPHAAAGPQAAKPDTDHAAEAATTEAGWVDALKGMVGLGDGEQEPEAQPEAPKQDEGAAAQSGEPQPAHAAEEDAPLPPAEAKADSHGAAWLAKMRSQPLTPEGHAGEESGTGSEPQGAGNAAQGAAREHAHPAVHAEASPSSAVAEEDDPEKRRKKSGGHAETH